MHLYGRLGYPEGSYETFRGLPRQNFKCVINDTLPLSFHSILGRYTRPTNTCMLVHSRSSMFSTRTLAGPALCMQAGPALCSRIIFSFFFFIADRR